MRGLIRFFQSLTGRLLLSQIGLVFIALALTGLVFVAIARPVQREFVYRRLSDNLLPAALMVRTQQLPQRPLTATQGEEISRQILERLAALLRAQSEAQRIRALLLDAEGERVLFDSAGQLEGMRWPAESLRIVGESGTRFPQEPFRAVRGRLLLAGESWSLTGARLFNQTFPPPHEIILIQMVPSPSLVGSLSSVMGDLMPWPALLFPSILLVTILLLSWGFSRSLSRGLVPLVDGTRKIAAGQLDFRIRLQRQIPTELRHLAENFNSMAADVQRSRRAQREFVANVGHDLRTPLTSIRGFAQALLDGTVGDESGRSRAARIIYDETERLSGLVEELLELARLDGGQLELSRTPLRLVDLLQRSAEVVAPRYRAAGIELKLQSGPADAWIFADSERMRRVLINLLDNSCTYSEAGARVTLGYQASSDDLEWEIFVVDTGTGIPEEDLPFLFDRFYQVDKSRKQGQGSGLGLAIVRDLVEAHGGHAGVASVEGLGTRFWIRMPRFEERSERS